MVGKMRVAFIACALLAITSSTYAISEPVGEKDGNKLVDQKTLVSPQAPVVTNSNNAETTTAEPKTPKVITLPPNVPITTKLVTSDHPTVTTASTNITTAPSSSNATTVITTTPSNKTTTTNATPTKPSSTTSPSVSTTATPQTTMSPPPSSSPEKDRHFDGLSFLGGIILAACLMAIGVFSWKFYRTCNERNYRTL